MTTSPPPLVSLTGDLASLLREQDPGLIDRLRRLADRVSAFVIGAEGRPAQLDPVAVATALTVRVPGVASVVFSDGIRDAPYNAARRFLSLDHLSGGRSGVEFSAGDADAAQTAERIDVIRALWNSWPSRTLLADRERRIYATTDDIRRIDHDGAFYRVTGPLNSPTSRQGEPVSLWRVATPADLERAQGLVDLVVIQDAGILDAWRVSPADGRPALASTPGTIGAHVAYVAAADLGDLDALIDDLPRRSGVSPADTLRDRLQLPSRAYDLSDKPLAFGAAR